MHYSSVIYILGLLMMFLSGSMLIPVPFSLYYGQTDYLSLLSAAGITFGVGFAAYRLSKFRDDLRPKEGFAIVAFSWIFLSFFGCLPFVFSGTIPSFTDAFFETMSGFTTTGATILTQIEGMPEGVLMWRSLTHWIGGMGIIVLSLAILPFLGVGGMQLFKAEVPGPVADKLTPRVTETAKILWGVYLVFTAAQTVLLMFGGMNLFEALCHAFGTLATGGYSTRNASVGAYGSAYIDYVIILFMLLAGTNFALHYRFLRGDFKVYFKNPEFLFYMAIIGFTALLICINNFIALDTGVEKTFRDSLFQVVSISTTTGYGTADYEQWPFASQMILFFLMFGGGCAGSTAGGMKMIRIYVLTKFVYSEIVRLLHPHAVVPVRVGKTIINRDILMNVFGFFNLYIIIFTLSVFAMSQLGLDFSSAYGAVVATMSNIGPGLGSVGPTDNFAHIPAIGKWLLSFLMMMGRLELFTVVILFSPSFWRK
ncbi:MAG: TrkH family potassium uptake protein [Calditrichaeota bacterium]|nr:TrkH family potassium uptake protein [Calditrichota bacterium]MCB0268521.1 TrkH family potassium uptake protein [Calditrichota bacterium]MCB0288039.1 TrkH family potassium uptake protein [Calditrichota bacterium]